MTDVEPRAEPSSARVEVVIVNHNTLELLQDCLDSLFSGGMRGVDARVWVVDNASTDGSADMVADRFPSVMLIRGELNDGFAAANNVALRAAGFGDSSDRGPQAHNTVVHSAPPDVLLLNPDTVVPPGAVAALARALRSEDDIGIVGPKLVLPDGRLDLACRRSFPTPRVAFYRFSGLAKAFPNSRRFGRYNMTFLDPDVAADVDAVVGACMMVRGEAVEAAGLLDERFWMYGEDLDWALRIRRAGWRTVYRPHVVVHHVKRASSSRSRRARYEFQRAMWLFYEKHYAASAPRAIDALVRLGLILKGGRRLSREMRAADRRALRHA